MPFCKLLHPDVSLHFTVTDRHLETDLNLNFNTKWTEHNVYLDSVGLGRQFFQLISSSSWSVSIQSYLNDDVFLQIVPCFHHQGRCRTTHVRTSGWTFTSEPTFRGQNLMVQNEVLGNSFDNQWIICHFWNRFLLLRWSLDCLITLCLWEIVMNIFPQFFLPFTVERINWFIEKISRLIINENANK